MYQADVITLSLMCGLLWCSVVDADCPYQECYCDGFSILCGNKGLTSLPQSFATRPSNLHSLMLDTNLITTIPAGSLPANLTEISLIENPIEKVDDAAFDGSAYTLNYLSFSQARFKRIPDALFHLYALEQLTIYETDIDDWNVEAMKHIGQTLVSLNLIQFSLETWPDWIQYLPHITELSIGSSSISTIPDTALDLFINSLTTLTLINNSLTAIPKALSKLTALESLNVQENEIVDIQWLPQSDSLRALDLENNNISDARHLSNALRPYAKTLVEVSIYHNQLTSFPDWSFLSLVGDIDFSNNQIHDPISGSLPPGVYHIDFRNNLLPSIPSDVLKLKYVLELMLTSNIIKELRGTDIPTWTQILQLDYNFIAEITDTSFPQNSSLTSLNINYNPVSKISISSFRNLPLLTELLIRGTKLTRVPLALLSLTKLNVIDIGNSTSLICTCLEKSLGPWFQKLYTYNVSGNCSATTIYDFFVNLSPSCPTRRGLL